MKDPRQQAADKAEAWNMFMFGIRRLGRTMAAYADATRATTEALERQAAEEREGDEWKQGSE